MRRFVASVAIFAVVSASGFAPAQAASPPRPSLNAPIYIPVTLGTSFTTHADAPAGSASRFAAAPVPNLDEAAPVLRTLGPARPEVAPSLFRRTNTYRGEGFTTGSSAESEQTRRIAPTPGVNLSMPLQ